MQNSPKISVIVPVYKVEEYLDRCVQSIVDQTYKNLEIILVDDGSPDNCPAMCDGWAKRDDRIKVIHQINAGSAQARNTGLDIAQGSLIAFVDSDDYIHPDMYQFLETLINEGFDIAECEYQKVYRSDAEFPNVEGENIEYSTTEALKGNITDTIFSQVIWNKLYRREIITTIRFPSGKKIDDEYFTYRVIGNAKKLIHSNQVLYAYRQQKLSAMHSLEATYRVEALEAKIQRYRYLEKNFPELITEALLNLWFTCLYQGQLSIRLAPRSEVANLLNYIEKILEDFPMKKDTVRKLPAKQKFWINMCKYSFKTACIMRNKLNIGL